MKDIDARSYLAKGYIVYPNVVPSKLLEAVIADIEKHLGGGILEYNNPSGLTEMYHYQSMWDIRQHPAVLDCFAEIFGTKDLWVSIDRVCRKAPFMPSHQPWPGFMHWDINPNQRPRPLQVQGLMALADADESMGGFWCLPEVYANLDLWIQSVPEKKILYPSFNVFDGHCWHDQGCGSWHDHTIWKIERVPLKAGDLLIWDSHLPHGNGPNFSDRIRYCQYVTMMLVGDERLAQERVNCWRNNEPPSDFAFPGDPRRIEQKFKTAELTHQGKLLLGFT